MHAATATANSHLHPVFRAALESFSAPAALEQAKRLAYVAALRGHDWSFEFSDDARAVRHGRESLAQLRLAQRELDPAFVLWNQHAPAQCRNGAAYH